MIYTLGITSGFGLEAVTQRELRDLLGVEHAPADNGMLTFRSDLTGLAKCNMWLRTAERVYIVVGKCADITTFDELFEAVRAMPWAQYLPRDAKIHLHGKSSQSILYGVPACQAIAKKAIVVSMTHAYHCQTLPETGVEYNITVRLHKDTLCMLIDTSGVGLHKRGWRNFVGEAAIKETMAAGMLLLSVWNKNKPLIDPFCGSGTIPIEAAMMARNMAPGLKRTHAYESWPDIDKAVAAAVRQEAESAIDRTTELRIAGYDIDAEAIKLCRHHAALAGVDKDIHFQCMDMRRMSSRYPYGVIVTNPPYGERLLDDKQVEVLMRDFYAVYKALPNWSLYLITAYPFLESAFGKKADKNRKMFNGKIQCRLYQYMGAKPPKE